MTWETLQQSAIDAYSCGRCKAEPGERCVTKSGAKSRYTHWRRVRPVQRAWVAGMDEARDDVLDAYDNNAVWFNRMLERRRKQRREEGK